ncbi:MAG: glycosyltransferase [Halioglobus sp.]|nr:glycosyltransferase [Halioglobus sp.]
MKFCMVTTFYPPYHFGGDATYVKALSEHLVARGHEVTVVHCENAFRLQARNSEIAGPEQENGVRVHRIRKRAGLLSPLITQQLGVPGLKSGEIAPDICQKFDVVNFHNISLIGGPALFP